MAQSCTGTAAASERAPGILYNGLAKVCVRMVYLKSYLGTICESKLHYQLIVSLTLVVQLIGMPGWLNHMRMAPGCYLNSKLNIPVLVRSNAKIYL